ncbi:hypothetical protein Q7P37_003464 [Cladosporium fusiforme]
MAEQIAFSLSCMAGIGSRAGSPGEMMPVQHMPIDENAHDMAFIIRDGSISFEPFSSEDKKLPPIGTQGWFISHGTKLILQVYADNVTVEAPLLTELSNLLPQSVDFTKTHFHRTEAQKEQRIIYLRPHDIVVFEDRACRIGINVVNLRDQSVVNPLPEGYTSDQADIQVKSSAQEPFHAGAATLQNPLADDDTDDDDDLDAPLHTPVGVDEITPATSRPTDGLAIKDTPSRPISHGSNHVFSTAPDKLQNDEESSTPAARAGALQKRDKQQTLSAEHDSQHVFGNARKGQKVYGGTPRRRHRITPEKEILDSPDKLRNYQPYDAVDDSSAEDEIAVQPRPSSDTMGSDVDSDAAATARKRKADDGASMNALSSTPPLKKPRGRQRKSTETAENDVEQPASTGKLRKPGRKSAARKVLENDEDTVDVAVSRSKDNVTPQSSGTFLASKPPTKILLSKSNYADDKKMKAWLKKHNTTIEENIPGKRSNFVCVVGKGVMGTTAKVVRSLALGKKVVTDQWLEDSMTEDQFLDLDAYIHDDLKETATVNRSKLFAGKTLFFTTALKASYGKIGFTNAEQLATEAGATHVESGSAKKAAGTYASGTIILGLEGDDRDAVMLTQEEGRKVYQKDLLTQSIIRGELLSEGDEFAWEWKGKKA